MNSFTTKHIQLYKISIISEVYNPIFKYHPNNIQGKNNIQPTQLVLTGSNAQPPEHSYNHLNITTDAFLAIPSRIQTPEAMI